SSHTQRASVTHALAEDAPRERQVVPVVPDGVDDLLVVVGLGLPRAVRLEPDTEMPPRALGRLDLAAMLACHRPVKLAVEVDAPGIRVDVRPVVPQEPDERLAEL